MAALVNVFLSIDIMRVPAGIQLQAGLAAVTAERAELAKKLYCDAWLHSASEHFLNMRLCAYLLGCCCRLALLL
jgi:hypothetical protein